MHVSSGLSNVIIALRLNVLNGKKRLKFRNVFKTENDKQIQRHTTKQLKKYVILVVPPDVACVDLFILYMYNIHLKPQQLLKR